MNKNLLIEINDLTKTFGKVNALDGITTSFKRGSITGLLGANGAGKSTLLRHIIGLYLQNNGSCRVFGVDNNQLGPSELARIGYVHQNGELINWMKVKQLIRYVKAYYPNWNDQIEQRFIEEFELEPNKRVAALSPGQKQRLSILLAICFEPELLILDEPAAGLDPIARAQFLELLLEIIQDQNRTVIISSHILSDVEKIIDHTIIMKNGQILTDSSFDLLQERYCRIELSWSDELPQEVKNIEDISLEFKKSGNMVVSVLKNSQAEKLTGSLEAKGCTIKQRPLDLEHLFKIIAR